MEDAIDLLSRWRPDAFRAGREYPEMVKTCESMRVKLGEEGFKRYSDCLQRFLFGWQSHLEFEEEVTNILPLELMDHHEKLISYITSACFLVDSRGSRLNVSSQSLLSKANPVLPDAFSISSLLLKTCIEQGFGIGDDFGQAGAMINSVLKTMLKDRIQDAIRVKRTHAVAEHGFIKYFGQKMTGAKKPTAQPSVPPISARDFLDSLVLTDAVKYRRLESEMENCESHTNFFYRMLLADKPELRDEQ